jgi:DNA-binding SARP family transcriptional activator
LPGRRASREEAGAFLWEKAGRARQAGNLRQLLFRVRGAEIAVDMRLLETTATEIILSPRNVSIDLRRFQAAIVRPAGGCRAACEAYSGDLLAGLTARGEGLESWLARQRATLRAEFLTALTPYVEAQANGPVEQAAIVAAMRMLEIDPRQEIAYRTLIQAYQERGDATRADQYRRQRDPIHEIRAEWRPAPVVVLPVERALRRNAPADAAAETASAPRLGLRSDELPRVIVSPHAPSYAPAAGRELVVELGADIATRLAQTRALTVLAVDAPAENEGAESGRLSRRGPPRPGPASAIQLRLLTLPEHQILWAASFADSSQYFERAPITLNAILRHIEDREISLSDRGDGARVAYRLTLEAQRLLNAIDLPSIRRARRLLRSAQTVAPNFVPTIAALARSHVMEWLVRAPFEVAPLEFAEQFAKQAIAISPDDHRGYHALGLVRVYRRRLDDGIECLNRAASLCPEDKACAPISPTRWSSTASRAKRSPCSTIWCAPSIRRRLHSLGARRRPFRPRGLRSDVAANQADEQSGAGVPHLRRRARLIGDVAGARRVMKASMDFNPNFDLRSWLAMAPCRDKDFVQRYTEGLADRGLQPDRPSVSELTEGSMGGDRWSPMRPVRHRSRRVGGRATGQ